MPSKRARTPEEIISHAKQVLGNDYDYSKLVFKGLRNKVEIICKLHGSFFHTLDVKDEAKGCKTCDFIKRSKKVHGNKYDYSKVVFKTVDHKVLIICPEHGEFHQRAMKHMRGAECEICGRKKGSTNRRISTEKFIKRAKAKHGNKFDYSKTKYSLADNKLIIICPKHGQFEITPYHHLENQGGCLDCLGEANRNRFIKSKEKFLEQAIKIHADKYDYSKVDYKGAKVKVRIICPWHGEFLQDPDHHLNRKDGCPKCGKETTLLGDTIASLEIQNKNPYGRLYVLELTDEKEVFYKIGITTKSVKVRYKNKPPPYDIEILMEKEIGLIKAYQYEQDILSGLSRFKYIPNKTFDGVTECLSVNPIDHDPYLAELFKDLD